MTSNKNVPQKEEWEPVIRAGMTSPQQMRRRDPKSGEWVYRDPTEAEIQDFLASEAW